MFRVEKNDICVKKFLVAVYRSRRSSVRCIIHGYSQKNTGNTVKKYDER